MPRRHWQPCSGLDSKADTALAHWLRAPGPSFMLPSPATHCRRVRRRGLHVSSLEHESPAKRQSLPTHKTTCKAVTYRHTKASVQKCFRSMEQECEQESWGSTFFLVSGHDIQNCGNNLFLFNVANTKIVPPFWFIYLPLSTEHGHNNLIHHLKLTLAYN